MNKPDQNTRLLEELLDRYKFARPVPEDIRKDILASKKKNLVRVLKTVGAFSALYGLLLSLYFAVKKAGLFVPAAKIVISGITAAAVSYGGYYAVKSLNPVKEPAKPAAKEERRQPVQETARWTDQITLYNGRVIEGAIISRGYQYKVLTPGGVMYVPKNQIKMVKPLRMEAAPRKPAEPSVP